MFSSLSKILGKEMKVFKSNFWIIKKYIIKYQLSLKKSMIIGCNI